MTVVASIFRNSRDYVDRYFTQICELEVALGEKVRLVIAEGDSGDDTLDLLESYTAERSRDTLLKVDHGGPEYRGEDKPERWGQIALVCNAVMDALPEGERVIYVESDLIWGPDTMLQLLKDLEEVEAVAPLSLLGGRFYDVWGHRDLNGNHFRPYEPFHDLGNDPLVEIGSAGSCVVMRPEVAKVARFGHNNAIVGLGGNIRHVAKAHLWLDQRAAVHHPT